jgi:tRNA(fMet)-specific endonuclease VapC
VSLTHLLDTSWIIRHLRGATAHTRTIQKIGPTQLGVSIVSLAELYEGVFRASRRADAEQALTLALVGLTVLPINDSICRLFGEHRALLRRGNQLIGDVDLLIATTCLHHALPLLTTNPGHFQRIPGLNVISTPF